MGETWLDLNLERDLLVVKGMEEDKKKNIESQPIHYNNSESSAHPSRSGRKIIRPFVQLIEWCSNERSSARCSSAAGA